MTIQALLTLVVPVAILYLAFVIGAIVLEITLAPLGCASCWGLSPSG